MDQKSGFRLSRGSDIGPERSSGFFGPSPDYIPTRGVGARAYIYTRARASVHAAARATAGACARACAYFYT
jgi:hypothetical protein